MNTFTNPLSGVQHCHFTVVLSAHHTHGLDAGGVRDEMNHSYHIALGARIHEIVGGLHFTEALGCYDDTQERSYVVNCYDIVEVLQMVELGHVYNQQCVLCIDHVNDSASLVYMDGQVSRIGKRLEQADIDHAGDYTLIGSTKYVVA